MEKNKKRTSKEKEGKIEEVSENKKEENKNVEEREIDKQDEKEKHENQNDEVHPAEKQIQEENKILKNILVGISVFIVLIVAVYFILNSFRNFEYGGVKFEIVKEGKLVLYKTSLPVTYQGSLTQYNFYLRNDPRKLDNISFDGNIIFTENAVINGTDGLNCDGDGIIAVANLVNLYKVLGINMIKDENATCDSSGRYSYINIQERNETSVEQFGPSCYNINVNNCEILKAMEKFMIEDFIEVNKKLKE